MEIQSPQSYRSTSPLSTSRLSSSGQPETPVAPGRIEEDDAFLCEGEQIPLPDTRVNDLALECWNLRKTVLDLNSQALKHQQDMKTQKNLLKNLQRLVHDVQEENKARTRESLSLKSRCSELEKKLAEANTNNTMLNNNINRYKKIMSSMQARVIVLEKEKKQLESSRDVQIATMKAEQQTIESVLKADLSEARTELHRLTTENQTLKSMLNESTDKASQFMALSQDLQKQVEQLNQRCENSADYLNRELELAYEQLHGKMEKIWNERVEAGKALWRQKYEQEQIMAFILREGLQLPEFPEPPGSPPFHKFADS